MLKNDGKRTYAQCVLYIPDVLSIVTFASLVRYRHSEQS
jgi:hypothetical protein